MNGRTYITMGFDASARICNLSADLGKCLSANIAGHRFRFKEQLKKSRTLQGGFILEGEELKKILQKQWISYPEITEDKYFHSERLRPQMQQQAAGNDPNRIINHYFHKYYTNSIQFAYSPGFVESISDCTRGYRTVDKDALLSLRSRYSRLFFIYLSGEADNFRFREETLRTMFGIQYHYKRLGSLKKRFDCVTREFSKLGIDFRWEFRKGSLYIEAEGMLNYRCSRKNEKVQERPKELSGEVISFLKTKLKMDDKGIFANKRTFLNYIFYFGEKRLVEFLIRKMKSPEYWKKLNRIGWLIGAVKGEIKKEQSAGRVEEKKTDVDNMEVTDPRIKEAIERVAKKLDSS